MAYGDQSDTDADVVIFEKHNDGTYFESDRTTLNLLGNVLPGFGDRLTLLVPEEGIAVYEVVGRYRVNMIGDDNEDDWNPWVLVVEQVDLDEFFSLERAIREVRRHDLALERMCAAPEVLDRSNRDPAYWTFERKRATPEGA